MPGSIVEAQLTLIRILGGSLIYPPDQLDALKDAIVRYQEKNDAKAAATFSLIYSSGAVRVKTFIA